MKTSAIVLAAGRGRRMGADVSKVFLSVSGVSILVRAAAALARVPQIDELIIVAHPSELARAADELSSLDTPFRVVAGGEERQHSSRAGVNAATGDLLLVHDAARPFPSPELIDRVIKGALRYGACVPVIPVVDTLCYVDAEGFSLPTRVDRTRLMRAQTPQAFRAALLREALAAWSPEAPLTDDASAVLAHGFPVITVDGDVCNIKITTPSDLILASQMAHILKDGKEGTSSLIADSCRPR
jgi:2-C-methyl-D-erythritol 4-phosphate cytidylyltransferase